MPSAAAKKKAERKKSGVPFKAGTSASKEGAGGAAERATVDHQMDDSVQVVFPSSLTSRQRAILHECGESYKLEHESAGEGEHRHIRLGPANASTKVDLKDSGLLSDADICRLLAEHFGIHASHLFSPPTNSNKPVPAGKSSAAARGNNSLAAEPVSLESFIHKMQSLLLLEKNAEVQQAEEATTLCSPETAQARGRSLLNLRCTDAEGGLLGRTLLTLVSNRGYTPASAPELPPHKFSPHDVVALKPNKSGDSVTGTLAQGVVYRVKDNAIIVAVDEAPEDGLDQPLRLDKLANEVTYQRLSQTLQQLAKPLDNTPGGPLVDVLFGSRPPNTVAEPPRWKPTNTSLDASQLRAVTKALAAKDVALIHGPPGTGKTTTVIEIILQEVARGNRVLAAAASNIAVDNLVERVASANPKIKLLRLGHPARLLPSVLDSSLEAHVLKADNTKLAKDCRKEVKKLTQQLMKLGPRERNERRAIRAELRVLAKEERKRQELAVKDVVKAAQVICCTLTGALHHHLQTEQFDVVIVDEAAQALEAACWGALLKGRKAVLAGDHLQLPPTILSDDAQKQGLGVTLFERLQHMYGPAISEMLTVQYRMNSKIMSWASNALYDGMLTAHDSVAGHRLQGSKQAGEAELPVLLLIDTAGCGFSEEREDEGDSLANSGEAQVVLSYISRLVQAGVATSAIGVITPYSAQVAHLKTLRRESYPALEISTVDGFQGREKEAIIISMVRSNDNGNVGFLSDQRRMNVAVTRARRQCVLVCDTETVGRNDVFLKHLVAHFEQHGEYMSAAELVAT